MFEVLNHYMPKIQASDVLNRMRLKKNKYFVVSAHREENISNDKNFFGLLDALNLIAHKYEYPIIVSTHPRTRKRLEQLHPRESAQNTTSVLRLHPLIHLQKPMGFSDYNALQMNAFAVLSDSGTISEESSIMNFRALNIRDTHERPEAMEEASVMMVGLNSERILQGLAQLERQAVGQRSQIVTNQQLPATEFRPVSDYLMPNVSDKIVRIILSYTSYIKRVVWNE
jgi:UDP-N-acetylglucosamine 2-epimerase (non-hydrolysing)